MPSDDRLFPGRLASQLGFADQLDPEWNISKVLTHRGDGTDAIFQLEWGTGDKTWLPYYEITKLQALEDYFEALGITRINQLRAKMAPNEPAIGVAGISIDPPSFGYVGRAPSHQSGGREIRKRKSKSKPHKSGVSAEKELTSLVLSLSYLLEQAQSYIGLSSPYSSTFMPEKGRPTPGKLKHFRSVGTLTWAYNGRTGVTQAFARDQVQGVFKQCSDIREGRYDRHYRDKAGYKHFAGSWNNDPTTKGRFPYPKLDDKAPRGIRWIWNDSDPMPKVTDVLHPIPAIPINAQRNDRGQIVYGRGRVVDSQNILRSQQIYDSVIGAAFHGGIGASRRIAERKEYVIFDKENKQVFNQPKKRKKDEEDDLPFMFEGEMDEDDSRSPTPEPGPSKKVCRSTPEPGPSKKSRRNVPTPRRTRESVSPARTNTFTSGTATPSGLLRGLALEDRDEEMGEEMGEEEEGLEDADGETDEEVERK
jgi:hypothetical protein